MHPYQVQSLGANPALHARPGNMDEAFEELKQEWAEMESVPQARNTRLKCLSHPPGSRNDVMLTMFDGPLLSNTEGSLFDQIADFIHFNTWESIIWCDKDSPIVNFPSADQLYQLYSVGCGRFWQRSRTHSSRADTKAHCKKIIDEIDKARIFQKAAEGKTIVLVLWL